LRIQMVSMVHLWHVMEVQELFTFSRDALKAQASLRVRSNSDVKITDGGSFSRTPESARPGYTSISCCLSSTLSVRQEKKPDR